MDGTEMTPQRNPVLRPGLVLAFVGIGVLGFFAGGGFESLQAEVPAGSAWGEPKGSLLAWPLAAFLLGIVLLRRTTANRRSRDDPARDALTGLYRRDYVDELLPRLMARDDRSGQSQIALALFAIDFLDQIEFRYGAAAVDQVFGLLGRLIRGQTRDGDIPARHGERSILVYLHCAESEQAQAFGRRLSMLLSREQIDWRGDAIKVSVSMGIALREPGETLDALHQRAGRHLTAAQQAGGKQIVA